MRDEFEESGVGDNEEKDNFDVKLLWVIELINVRFICSQLLDKNEEERAALLIETERYEVN